jgi:hypothetical protein
MPIFDTYSKRQIAARPSEKSEIFRYSILPREFRVQVIHILNSSLGCVWPAWQRIHDAICRETGKPVLSRQATLYKEKSDRDGLASRVRGEIREGTTEEVLDITEIAFRIVENLAEFSEDAFGYNGYAWKSVGVEQSADDAVAELNHRFREHRLGYQYLEGQIIRLDSQFLHEEVVKRSFGLLKVVGFDGAFAEFMTAYDHFLHGRYKEAIVNANNAFESTMKSICAARTWNYASNSTASGLTRTLFEHDLIPEYIQSHLHTLRATLDNGLPQVRHNTGGHGQGPDPATVNDYVAAYALHLVATNIVMLVEAHRAMPS